MSDAKCQIKSTLKAPFKESSARQSPELSEYVQLTDLSWFVDTDVYISQTHTSHCHLELLGCNISRCTVICEIPETGFYASSCDQGWCVCLFPDKGGMIWVIWVWYGDDWVQCDVASHSSPFRFFSGAGGHHRGPPGGGDPPVSRVLPSLLLSGPLPHAPPAPLPGSPSLHPQLSLFLPPCQSRGAAPPPVLPAPPSPHVRRSRYGHADWT